MGLSTRRKYDDDLKAEVVIAALEPGASLREVAERYGLYDSLVRSWVSQARLATGQPPGPPQRRIYSPRFKAELIREVRTSGMTAPTVARKHRIAENLVTRWVREAGEAERQLARGEDVSKLQAAIIAEIAALKDAEAEQAERERVVMAAGTQALPGAHQGAAMDANDGVERLRAFLAAGDDSGDSADSGTPVANGAPVVGSGAPNRNGGTVAPQAPTGAPTATQGPEVTTVDTGHPSHIVEPAYAAPMTFGQGDWQPANPSGDAPSPVAPQPPVPTDELAWLRWENQRLQGEVTRLTKQVDFLHETAAYFASRSLPSA